MYESCTSCNHLVHYPIFQIFIVVVVVVTYLNKYEILADVQEVLWKEAAALP